MGSRTSVVDTSSLQVHVGPLEATKEGVVIKPKMNLGVRGGVIKALVGVRDVRNGLAADATAGFVKSYATRGNTLRELLVHVKAQEKAPAIDDIIEKLPRIAAAVLEQLDVDIDAQARFVEGVLYVYVGVGVTAGAYLGWMDTTGYHMLGVEGQIATLAGLGLTLRVGAHKSRTAVRIVCYMSNVGFDVILHVKHKLPALKTRARRKSTPPASKPRRSSKA